MFARVVWPLARRAPRGTFFHDHESDMDVVVLRVWAIFVLPVSNIGRSLVMHRADSRLCF